MTIEEFNPDCILAIGFISACPIMQNGKQQWAPEISGAHLNLTEEKIMLENLPRDDNGKLDSWAWPGGYPIFYLDSHECVLCPDCANKAESEEEDKSYWPKAFGINFEDSFLYCDGCNEKIESAYGADDDID